MKGGKVVLRLKKRDRVEEKPESLSDCVTERAEQRAKTTEETPKNAAQLMRKAKALLEISKNMEYPENTRKGKITRAIGLYIQAYNAAGYPDEKAMAAGREEIKDMLAIIYENYPSYKQAYKQSIDTMLTLQEKGALFLNEPTAPVLGPHTANALPPRLTRLRSNINSK